ncbi:MAG: alpha/beta hydrolase [Holophagales bacterium]|nr:alpha/beta hydrolase [Holophagales bacterium]
MTRPVKILLAAVLFLVLAGIVVFLIARMRPLAMYAASGRRALLSAGLSKSAIASPVGPQTVFKGGSGPVLVLLHGAGDQAAGWSIVAPKLLTGRTLVIPDLAGHGDSAPGKGPLPVETLLSGLSAVLDEAAPTERVTIVGNSLGAWLACLWAKEHPERVERIVLVNGGPLKHVAEGLTLQPKDRAEARETVDALRDPGSIRVPDFVLDDVVREAAKGPIARLAAASDGMEKFVLEGRLGELTIPVDILWGASDRMMPLSYAERMRAELTRVRLTALPRCGHVPQQECPAAFAEALSKLLAGPVPDAAATGVEPQRTLATGPATPVPETVP